ncbi:uncharacterized protein [Anoplolepis gracilipes]|uniref:uncharacterized protein isoform X8 n=1 Tax=Anoplolepis gracilipes TaxID=354296 RepID=UPI003BA1B7D3
MWYKSFELWCCAFLFLVSSSKSRNFTIKNKQDNNSIVRYERHANFSPKNGQTDFNRYNLRKNFLHENAQDVFHSNSKSIHHKDDYSMQNKFPVHYVKYYEKGNRITSELQMNFKKFNKDNIDTENDNKNDVVSYMTCENNICINLCCPPGNRLVSDSCIAEEAEYALPNVHGLIDLEHNESKVDEMFQLIVQNPCKNNGNEIIKLPLYDHMFYFQYIFLENGTLYLPYFHEFVDVKNYCLAVVDGNQEFDAFICSETSKTMKTFVKKLHENFKMELITYKLKIVHFSYCMISVLCMLTIFLIYSVPELNNMHGFMLCRYTSASFMFYLVEIIFPYYKILAYSTCVTKVSMSYYFLMAGNFWLCVMSFDMWWTFSKNPKNWKPTRNTKICSAHFINNIKSENPLHPFYLPTIFPDEVNVKKSTQSVERFERQRRSNRVINIKKSTVNNNCIEMEQHNDNFTETEQYNNVEMTNNASRVIYHNITCQMRMTL